MTKMLSIKGILPISIETFYCFSTIYKNIFLYILPINLMGISLLFYVFKIKSFYHIFQKRSELKSKVLYNIKLLRKLTILISTAIFLVFY